MKKRASEIVAGDKIRLPNGDEIIVEISFASIRPPEWYFLPKNKAKYVKVHKDSTFEIL